MTVPAPNLIVLSRATYVGASGVAFATPAATYQFFSSDYRPPSQERSFDTDVVHNQNGKFKYLYDNGPGFKKWSPFNILCEERLGTLIGQNAAQQLANLLTLWEHPGVLGMRAPEGTYIVHWAENMDRNFRVFPINPTGPQEFAVSVQFDEAQ